jgi:hypothetical protein
MKIPVVVLVSALAGFGQGLSISPSAVLSIDEVKLALSGTGKNHFVLIQDMGLMAAQGNQVPSIILYMPEALLAIRADSAKNSSLDTNRRKRTSGAH